MPLRAKQQKLFTALRTIEQAGDRLTRSELEARLVRETGYKEIKTYMSKFLESVIVRSADDTFGIRGVLVMTDDDFATLLTQKRLGSETHVVRYENRDEWAEVVRSLLEYGARHDYVLDVADVALVASVLPVGIPRTSNDR